MSIIIQDKGLYIDFYVDNRFSARIKTYSPDLPEEDYQIIRSDERLHDMVLGVLFKEVMKRRKS